MSKRNNVTKPQKRGRVVIMGFFLFALAASSVKALEAEVKTDVIGAAKQLWVQLKYIPGEESLAAIDINLHLSANLDISSINLAPPQTGPWSQITPQLSREGNKLNVKAISPNMLFSRKNTKLSVFQLHVGLNENANISSSADVIENYEIVKSLNPSGETIGNMELQLSELTSVRGKSKGLSKNPEINYRHLNRMHSVTFNLAEKVKVRARVMDLKGNTIVQLLDAELSRGMRKISWNGTDWQGKPVSAGVYFIQLEIGTSSYNKKVRHNP